MMALIFGILLVVLGQAAKGWLKENIMQMEAQLGATRRPRRSSRKGGAGFGLSSLRYPEDIQCGANQKQTG